MLAEEAVTSRRIVDPSLDRTGSATRSTSSATTRGGKTGEDVGVTLGWSVAWDGSRAVFEAVAGGTQHALLALDVSGQLTRVSDVVTREPDEQGFVFSALP